ncbi:hypothetical protein PAJ34TS1_54860 [Paenibacillus azoreducens]|uniref:Uncharacterized protein n=1 Tax=Paenibacillus azoreducens TaxID=116718 RepID=A0A919YD45_9BACL|nr:hypothetical protein J34TS1_30040 [Paenibacillus azoreducens]
MTLFSGGELFEEAFAGKGSLIFEEAFAGKGSLIFEEAQEILRSGGAGIWKFCTGLKERAAIGSYWWTEYAIYAKD